MALVAVAVLLVGVGAGAASAISTSAETVPDEKEVGTDVSATFVVDEAMKDQPSEWTLKGETDIAGNLSWHVSVENAAGETIDDEVFENQTFTYTLDDSNVATVRVTVQGTVPEIEEYSYDPAERFTIATLSEVVGGTENELHDPWTVHHYTEDSREARNAIDDANDAIDDARAAGGDVSEAESTLDNAVEAYESGNFDLAVDLAGEAESQADDAGSAARTQQMLLYGGGAVALLLVAGGGAYWYRSRQETHDKLG